MNAYVADPVEWVAVFKMPDEGPPGLWRLAFPCDPGLPDDALLDPAAVQRRMKSLVFNESYEIRYQSVYRVHQRVASEWRQGRVLLAGDAAHLNNPLGGFGLNSGIHDAVNLAEKLAQVWRGEAGEALLDLYVRQRRATTIDQVQAMSIRNKRLLEEREPEVHRKSMEELVAVAADPPRARQYLLESSMIAGLRKSMEIH
jgi:3-(3-hydroxy-phenyl)propionate hydroxylase